MFLNELLNPKNKNPKLIKLKLLSIFIVLDIAGKGDMNGILENCRARVKMRATKYVKDGENYLKFEKFNLKIQIGKNTLNLKNLFNGNFHNF
jgi:hypothetical protein